MVSIPMLSGKELISVLEGLGFFQVRQRGSHVVLRKHAENRTIVCVVPLHRDLALGTLRGVLKQAELTPEEFIAARKRRSKGARKPH